MGANLCSYGGRILRVNLTTGRISVEPIEKHARNFVGGRGIDSWILYEEVKPGISPFDPANRFVIGTGVLVGTLAPAACRHSVDAKSPITDGIGSGNSCGHFSAELKYAGFDHIIVQGRARSPVYLWIGDHEARVMDASHIWGKTTGESEDILRETLGDDTIQIACIGPAGENLVRSACVISNRSRAAARCGLGAVMGSKNLKAIAVRGSGSIEVAHPNRFMNLVNESWERIRTCPSVVPYRTWGTFRTPEAFNELGHLPVKNFQDEYLHPDILKKVDPEYCKAEYEVGRLGYSACPISCGHFYRINDGAFAGLAAEGIETNDILNFVSKLEIDNLAAVIKLHSLCSQYGLDEDNASGAISWAFECYQHGILTEEDADGLKLEWGDAGVVAELLRKLAYREGVGDLLAEGAKRAADMVGMGSERLAIHIKGQDSVEALRGSGRSWALGCVVSTRGGTHTRGANLVEMMDFSDEVCERVYGIPGMEGRLSYDHKAELVVYYEKLRAITDSLGICNFVCNDVHPDLLGPEELAEFYSAATGHEVSGDELMVVGQRIHNVEKAFNALHAGYSRKDDYPPQRFMDEPIQSGPMKGELLEKENWEKMLDAYYNLQGWDRESGWQTRRCLEDLGLKDIADDLEKGGRLRP